MVNVEKIDNNNVDILPILIDLDIRNALKIEPCAPVRIYRSLTNELYKKLHLISAPLLLSLIAALITFELSDSLRLVITIFGVIIIIIMNFISIKIKV